MRVLSLFDGISCGKLALERAGIPITSYIASEIDKYAISISKKNHPDIKHIGDVRLVTKNKVGEVDLLIAGSPCQGFSMAGKRLNFNDDRSKLFFEFLRLIDEVKPKYFLLENVRMRKDIEQEITNLLGVEPITINSSLVSAQNRLRLYWTNIKGITQPEDKNIILKDVLEPISDDKYYISDKMLDGFQEKINRGKNRGFDIVNIRGELDKSSTLTARYYKCSSTDPYILDKSKLNFVGGIGDPNRLKDGKDFSRNYRDGYRVYSGASIIGHGSAHQTSNLTTQELRGIVRRLTPLECERLQTLPDNYTEGCSDTQRYKMIGNGWTVDVIKWIFSFLPVGNND